MNVLKNLHRFASLTLPTLLLTSALYAQTPAAPAGQPGALQDAFNNMGPIGWALLILSIVSLALIIESFVKIKREKFAPPELVDELEALFEEGNYQEALDLCESNRTYLTNVVDAGLRKLGNNYEVIQTTMREMQEEETVKLFQKVGWISIIAATAPLLGLLGTMIGMFFTFGAIAQAAGSVQPATLAYGIKMKLVNTIMGLFIAIPMSLFFFLFRNKVMRATIETNAITEELFERFRKKEAKEAR